MKILVIDDDRSILMLVSKWLEGMGFKVDGESNGKLGLNAFLNGSYDLIISDVDMPEMTGFELATEIRKVESKWIPIIFMSASTDPGYYKRGMDAGGDFYFEKPLVHTTFEAFLHGIDRMQAMRRTLESASREVRAIHNSNTDGIITINHKSNITSINKTAHKIFGYNDGELQGKNLRCLLPPDIAIHHQRYINNAILDAKQHQGKGRLREIQGLHKDGHQIPLEISLTPDATGEEIFFTGIIRDTTERKKLEEKLKALAQYDTLTGLPNRSLFFDRLKHALDITQRSPKKLALMFLDLDNFKFINDNYGHDQGDALLKEIAKRLTSALRKSDTVARLAGDEFTVILENIEDSNSATIAAENILANIKQPFRLSDTETVPSVSIGVAITDGDLSPSALIKQADTAMYSAKKLGKNQVQFFTPELNGISLYRKELTNALFRAIERLDISISYTPLYTVSNNEICGIEAGLAWTHPDIGLVPPHIFLPLLEETGLINRVTDWMLRESIQAFSKWQSEGHLPKNIKLGLKISDRHFHQTQLASHVKDILTEAGIAGSSLIFNVAETAFTKSENKAIDSFLEMGISIVIHGFGEGSSAIGTLIENPVTGIQLHPKFATFDQESKPNRKLLSGIIEIAKSLELNVSATDVNSKEYLEHLQKSECDSFQGNLIAQALSEQEFEKLIS